MDIKEKVKRFPDAPGVYLMKDVSGSVLYVGKAASLKKRVSSYYQKPPVDKIQKLLSLVHSIGYIQTTSGAQALLLENTLIKKYSPYYNTALKDDKSYPFIMIVDNAGYPYVRIGRGERKKGVRYYGPYTSATELKIALKTIRTLFPFRSCRHLPKKACLYLQLGLCPGMCVRDINPSAYKQNLRRLGLFLQGKYSELLAELKENMRDASRRQLFEEAAHLRDEIRSLRKIIFETKETCAQDVVEHLKNVLNLEKFPRRIEAFDISEIAGEGLCGSMVSFVGGVADKNAYRKFKIKTVHGVDDCAMIREVVYRRYVKKDAHPKLPLPDLVMVDGGKGQWSSVRKVLNGLGLKKLPVISLAKRLELVFSPQGRPLRLARDCAALYLLQRIRDEAHRFAISYHRNIRAKKLRSSVLDEIDRVGPMRKRLLLRHFKSVQAIKEASLEDLLNIKGIDRKTAENIMQFK